MILGHIEEFSYIKIHVIVKFYTQIPFVVDKKLYPLSLSSIKLSGDFLNFLGISLRFSNNSFGTQIRNAIESLFFDLDERAELQ